MPDTDRQDAALAHLVACAVDPTAPLADTARGLRGQKLIVLPSPKDMTRYLQELTAKVGANLENLGKVKATDAAEPALMGVQGPDGFVVSVFTSDGGAREHMVTSGAIEPTAALMFSPRPWLTALREFREDEYGGLVLDEGTAHRVALDRAGLERLWAALERDRIETASELLVVTRQGRLHTERRPDGFIYAFVFADPRDAEASMVEMRKYGPFDTVSRPKAALLEEFRAAGVERVRADHGFMHRQDYTAPAFFAALEGRDAVTPGPATDAGPAPDPALDTMAAEEADDAAPAADSLAGRAAAAPHAPALPPTVDDATSRTVFKTWQKRADQRTCEPWQFLDALAYEASFYVTVAPQPLEGLTWPLFHRVRMQPENKPAAMVYLFTTEAAVSAFVAERPPEAREYKRLSGIEMFRWLWAYPGEGSHVSIDYPDEAGWITFPLYWLRTLLLPLSRDFGDLSGIDRVPLARLGAVGGPPRLKPAVIKALSLGWKPLMGLKPAEDGTLTFDTRDGTSYLPAFSGEEQFFAFASKQTGQRVLPAPPARTPPFTRWLEASRNAGGVVIDPAGPNPLTLDRITLVLLDRCAELGRYPDMTEYVAAAARHHAAGRLSDEELGRAVAEVSVFFMGLGKRPDGGAWVLHMANDPDTGVLFTTEAGVQAFMSRHGVGSSAEALWNAAVQQRQPTGMQPVGRGVRWFVSPIRIIEQGFTEVVVDPAPDGSGGCRVNRTGLQAASRYLEEVLRPRVDGFIRST